MECVGYKVVDLFREAELLGDADLTAKIAEDFGR